MPAVDWRDESAGAAKRVAHYLATQVGEGGTFRKSTLREIVEDTEQVDRRMRQLRSVGWVIRNYKDLAELKTHELQLERIGDRVWEVDYRWPRKGITAGTRRKVFDRDGPRCLVCGMDFGAEFPGRPGMVARGTIGHIVPQERGGTDDLDNLRPECQLCNEPARNLTSAPPDVALLLRRVRELSRKDKQMLLSWMTAGSRTYSDRERLWAQFVQLPSPLRDGIVSELSNQL